MRLLRSTRQVAADMDVPYTHAAKVVAELRHCRLRGALRRVQEAFYAALDPVTVAEIVTDPTGPLLLGISRGPQGG